MPHIHKYKNSELNPECASTPLVQSEMSNQMGHPPSTRGDVIQARLVHVGCPCHESCNQGLLSRRNPSQCQPMEVGDPSPMTQRCWTWTWKRGDQPRVGWIVSTPRGVGAQTPLDLSLSPRLMILMVALSCRNPDLGLIFLELVWVWMMDLRIQEQRNILCSPSLLRP